MNAQITTRPAIDSDKAFIISTWLSGQYHGSPYWSQMPKEVFYSEYTEIINSILHNPDTRVNVAILSDDPNVLLGFTVYSRTTMHWIYTKKDYRSSGIMRLLWPNNITTASSTTLPGAAIARKKKLIFNPIRRTNG